MTLPVLEMWSDLHCPYAYLAAFRLRRALEDLPGRIEVRHRSLAIEFLDSKCTPKGILDAETPILMREEAGIPHSPWRAHEWEWPVTMWPAFEAVKAAERQGWRRAHELDWRLREAFFSRSRCISMRHVLLDEARAVPLEMDDFTRDWDAGTCKAQVLAEAREGWEDLKLQASPTFLLPDGARFENPVSPHVELSEDDPPRVLRVTPPREKVAPRAFYLAMLERVAKA
jgi:predicted DsbA family dithiol-disulfide isomerase